MKLYTTNIIIGFLGIMITLIFKNKLKKKDFYYFFIGSIILLLFGISGTIMF